MSTRPYRQVSERIIRMETIDRQTPLLVDKTREQFVSFRRLVSGIPSTTYATFGLYRYPAKFIPQVIAYVLDEYARPGMTVIDPFAGYGTAGVVSRVYGHDYELWDLNPLLDVFHEVATMEPREVDLDSVLSMIRTTRETFVPKWSNLGYWFPEEFLPVLSRSWGLYHSTHEAWLKLVMVIPLLKTTRYFSYDDTQRQKLSKSPKSRARIDSLLHNNWQDLFYSKLRESMANILRRASEYQALSPKPVRAVVRGGADTLTLALSEGRDILITSPPYLQAQEYMRQAKMDLFWLGFSEAVVKELSKKEIPYRAVQPCSILSETYLDLTEQIKEPHIRRTFDRYFWGILGALTRLQEQISSYLFLFVGPATIRGRPIPIDRIFIEHFVNLGWTHEATLKDAIVARQMFLYANNPATGLKDERMMP